MPLLRLLVRWHLHGAGLGRGQDRRLDRRRLGTARRGGRNGWFPDLLPADDLGKFGSAAFGQFLKSALHIIR